MFGDDRDKIEIDVERALETITVEDLLADNDLTIVQALAILVDEGFIVLPDIKALL
jgi:thiazole synthase ThiGH ThiG subunit